MVRPLALVLAALAAPLAGRAQTVARLSFGAVADAPVGELVTVAVDARGLADARTVEFRVAYPVALFAPEGAAASGGPGSLRVLAAGDLRPDSLGVYRVVLSHTAALEATSTLRTRTIATLRGRRLAPGPIALRFVPTAPAVVTRTLGVQAAEYGVQVETSAPETARAGALRLVGVRPHPVGDEARLVVDAPGPMRGRLRVLDALGRTVHVADVRLDGGVQALPVPTAALAAGLYAFRLDATGPASDVRLALSGTFLRRP